MNLHTYICFMLDVVHHFKQHNSWGRTKMEKKDGIKTVELYYIELHWVYVTTFTVKTHYVAQSNREPPGDFLTVIVTSCIDFKYIKTNTMTDALKYLYSRLSFLVSSPSWLYLVNYAV